MNRNRYETPRPLNLQSAQYNRAQERKLVSHRAELLFMALFVIVLTLGIIALTVVAVLSGMTFSTVMGWVIFVLVISVMVGGSVALGYYLRATWWLGDTD